MVGEGPLTVGPPTAAATTGLDLSTLTAGRIVEARVTALAGQMATLASRQGPLEVDLGSAKAAVGDLLRFEVRSIEGGDGQTKLQLELTSTRSDTAAAVATAATPAELARRALGGVVAKAVATQTGLSPLYASLAGLASAPAGSVPEPVRALVTQMMNGRLGAEGAPNAASVASAFRNSGLFLEARGGTAATAATQSDLKGLLGRLRTALEAWVGRPAASPQSDARASAPTASSASGATTPATTSTPSASGLAVRAAYGGTARASGGAGPEAAQGGAQTRLAMAVYGGAAGSRPTAAPPPSQGSGPATAGGLPPEAEVSRPQVVDESAATADRGGATTSAPTGRGAAAAASPATVVTAGGPAAPAALPSGTSASTGAPGVPTPAADRAAGPALPSVPVSPTPPTPLGSSAGAVAASPAPTSSPAATAAETSAGPPASPAWASTGSGTPSGGEASPSRATATVAVGGSAASTSTSTSTSTSPVGGAETVASPGSSPDGGVGTEVVDGTADAGGSPAPAVRANASSPAPGDATAPPPPPNATASAGAAVAQKVDGAGDDPPSPASSGLALSVPEAAEDTASAVSATIAGTARERGLRPPPPRRGQMPIAQGAAGRETVATASEAESLGRRALARTDGALQRILLEQWAVLDDHGPAAASIAGRDGREWTAELPLATSTGTSIMQMTVERDGGGSGREASGASVGWRVRFALDVEPIGPVHAQIGLSGDHLSVGLWIERPEMAARLAAQVGELTALLSDDRVTIDAVHVAAGQPPAAPGEGGGAGHFIDVSL